MRVQLSGPVTGLPDRNSAAFAGARLAIERMASACGFEVEVFDPTERVPEGASHAQAMRQCLSWLVGGCDVLAQLDGCSGSKGATVEAAVAASVGTRVMGVGSLLLSMPSMGGGRG